MSFPRNLLVAGFSLNTQIHYSAHETRIPVDSLLDMVRAPTGSSASTTILSPWRSTQDMMRSVFADIHTESIRDFILHTRPFDDAEYLTSPSFLSRSVSSTGCLSGEKFTEDGVVGVGLMVPVGSLDGLEIGLNIESMSPGDSAEEYLRSSNQLFHVVLNPQFRRLVSVALDYNSNTALVYYIDTHRIGVMLHFHLQPFLRAFRNCHQVNFVILEREILYSCVFQSVSVLEKHFRTLPSDTGPVLKGENLPSAYRVLITPWNYHIHCSRTFYNNGIKVRATPSSLAYCENFGTYAGTVDSLKEWALGNMLSCLSPTMLLPFPSDGQCELQPPSNVIQIAPAHGKVEKQVLLSDAQIAAELKEAKKERRRVRNRISAAKSNARRRIRNKAKKS